MGIQRIKDFLSGYPLAAIAIYLALVALFVFVSADNLLQILQRRDALASASEILERIGAHDPSRARAAHARGSIPAGSPFLEGASASVAGAALLQRVADATTRMNGNTLSSQVDLQGPQSKAGFIRATSTLEIDSSQLQPLLYDLEAGMPFLFVDELVVQAPSTAAQGSKLRVVLSVSGQRPAQK